MHFSIVFLNCIFQFFNRISQLYFLLCPIHHCKVQPAPLSNAQLPQFTVAGLQLCTAMWWVILYEKLNVMLLRLCSVGYDLSTLIYTVPSMFCLLFLSTISSPGLLGAADRVPWVGSDETEAHLGISFLSSLHFLLPLVCEVCQFV